MILNLEVLGVRQATVGFTGVLAHIKDIRPLAEPWDWRFRKNAERHWRGEGTHKGPWAALSRATQLHRERLGYPPAHPILVMTGDLKNSLLNRGHSQHILDAHPRYIEFGTKVPHAIYHQKGTSKMPQRLMVAIDAKDLSRMVEDARRYIMDGQVGVGGV